MRRRLHIWIFWGLVIALTGAARAFNYMWLTNREMTIYSGHVSFWSGDTMRGPVHSNSEISIMQDPQFYDRVSTTESDFWRGSGYSPGFHGPPVNFRAPVVPIPRRAERLRTEAAWQGRFYSFPGDQVRVIFDGSVARLYRWRRGVPFHSANHWTVQLSGNTCIFVDAPVQVKGRVAGRVTLGSSQLIDILDDVTVYGADSLGRVTDQSNPNLIGLASEGDIKIHNSPENGRENSGMPNGVSGRQQTDMSRTSVVITAMLYALNESVTFEQQNDPDSGYVCDCVPDERGTLYIWGGIVQQRRGIVHRTNNGGTGYRRHLRYDERLRNATPPGMFDWGPPLPATTDTINFGNVVVGTTVWDTAEVFTRFDYHLGAVYANYPFYATRHPPLYGDHFVIPARFTPPGVGQFSGILYVSAGAENAQIVLRGRGVPQGGPLTLEIAPNPFNLTTTIRFALPETGDVKITIFDILGRTAREIHLPQAAAGEHALAVNGAELASGIYFARFHYRDHMQMRKLVLLK